MLFRLIPPPHSSTFRRIFIVCVSYQTHRPVEFHYSLPSFVEMLRRFGSFVLLFFCISIFLFPDLLSPSTLTHSLVSSFLLFLELKMNFLWTENSSKCGPSKTEFLHKMCRSTAGPLGPIDSRVCARRRLQTRPTCLPRCQSAARADFFGWKCEETLREKNPNILSREFFISTQVPSMRVVWK